MKLPPVTASNPYQDLAKLNGLDYGDVLNYVGILDGEERTYWHTKALRNLTRIAQYEILNFRYALKRHYGICSQPTLKPS